MMPAEFLEMLDEIILRFSKLLALYLTLFSAIAFIAIFTRAYVSLKARLMRRRVNGVG